MRFDIKAARMTEPERAVYWSNPSTCYDDMLADFAGDKMLEHVVAFVEAFPTRDGGTAIPFKLGLLRDLKAALKGKE